MRVGDRDLQLTVPFDTLKTTKGSCPKCSKKCWIYCASCCIALNEVKDLLPIVKLNNGLKVTILQHPHERSRKSSAIPLKILAPESISLHLWGVDPPPSFDKTKSVLLFPSDDARDVTDIDWKDIEEIVVVDGSWQGAKTITQNPKVMGLTTVRLKPYKTQFWRYNTRRFIEENNLATAEAVYYLLREIEEVKCSEDKEDQKTSNLDDLLWIFSLQLHQIEKHHSEQPVEIAKRLQKRRAEISEGAKKARKT